MTDLMTDPWTRGQPAPAVYPQVDLPGAGLVSLATLDELRDGRRSEQANADHLSLQAAELDDAAEERYAAAGALLVPRRALWPVPAPLAPSLDRAERSVARVAWLDRQIRRLEPELPSGTLGRLRAWASRHTIGRERARTAARLRQTLVRITREGARAGVAVPDVEPLLEEAAELDARAEGLRTALASATQRLSGLDHEIRLREEAERSMGFDSLYAAAYFSLHGLPAVQAPIELQPDEVAYQVVEAELARVPIGTMLVKGSGGRMPPREHTGLPHWTGLFHDRAAPQHGLRGLDEGCAVVTNRRLAFAGNRQPVTIPLGSIVEIDVYEDAVGIVVLERENPDFLLVAAPKALVLYLNWAMRSGIFD